MNRNLPLAFKIVMIVWGFVSLLLGAGVSSFYLDNDSFMSRVGVFIILTYCSVLLSSLIALLSSRVAAALSALAALSAVALIVLSRQFGNPLNVPSYWLSDIAIRPGVAALVFFALGRLEQQNEFPTTY
jgi:hypothetical protein